MRTLLGLLAPALLAAALVTAWAAAADEPSAPAPSAAQAPPAETAAPGAEDAKATERWFQLSARGERAGYLMSRTTESTGQIKIEETFRATFRGKQARMQTTVIYADGKPPQPISAQGTTTLNGAKLMEGTLQFLAAGASGLAEARVQVTATGYADKKLNKFDPVKSLDKTVAAPPSPVIFQSALAVIGPKLLPEAGKVENVTVAEFVDDLAFPELVNFKSARVLVRSKPNDEGQWSVGLGQTSPQGGPPVMVFEVFFDNRSEVTRMSYGNWQCRRVTREEALKPLPAEPAPTEPAPKE